MFSIVIASVFGFIGLIVEYYSIKQFFVSFVFIFSLFICMHSYIFNSLISMAYFYLICYYFVLRSKHLIRSIHKLNESTLFIKHNCFKNISNEHNNLCQDLYIYNNFWERFYFCVIVMAIPINLF